MEEWKDVVGFENHYQVSNMGNLRSKDRIQSSYGGRTWTRKGKLMKPTSDGRYQVVSLAVNGTSVRKYLHEVVLTAFVGPRPSGYHACHGMEGSLVNKLANLRWDTASANSMDKHEQGTMPLGERHGRNVYSAQQIAAVKAMIGIGHKNRHIMEQTGVKMATIQQVRKGRQWAT